LSALSSAMRDAARRIQSAAVSARGYKPHLKEISRLRIAL